MLKKEQECCDTACAEGAQTKTYKLSTKQKIIYAVGDFSLGGTFNIINIFYPIFLSSIIKLDPFWVAAVFLIARIYDAVTDVIMGFWSDKTTSKLGRRKPYIFFGTLFLLISFLFLFFPFKAPEQPIKFILVLISYVFFYSVQTVISTSYYALGGELTNDYKERNSLMTLRLFCSLIGTGVCSVLPSIILGKYSYQADEVINGIVTSVTKYTAQGYTTLAWIFGIVFTVFLLVTGIFVKERPGLVIVKPDAKMFKNIWTPLTIKTARQYMVIQALKCTCMAFVSTLAPYFVTYYLRRPQDLSLVLGVLFATELLSLPFWSFLATRISKAKTFILGSVIWMVAGVMMFFVTPQSGIFMYICIFLLGFGMCGVVLMPNSMFGDITDLGELKYGDRREGVFAGFESISYKIASAIATSLIMVILGFTTFNVEPYGNQAVLTIRIMLSFSPFVFLIGALITACRYKLDNKTHDRLKNLLVDIENNDYDENEKEALMKELL